ncbi:MAG: hypothetical protein K6E88_01355 [Lachnospiraceae bacterium]|nr:hypothetical protein [Lachnospiraceae bacterium]
MEFNINRLEEYGVDPGTGIEYTGNYEKYINTLKRYNKSYEENRSRVVKALAAMDIDDYTIIVHSLKSNSRMIGAGELSTRFETLELAARAGNTSVLISDTPAVLDIYDTLIRQLAPLDEDDETAAATLISAEEAHKTVDELLYALDEFDDELSSKLVLKLSGYPFGDKEREKVDKVIGYISEFMYDEAADIIKQIAAAIK